MNQINKLVVTLYIEKKTARNGREYNQITIQAPAKQQWVELFRDGSSRYLEDSTDSKFLKICDFSGLCDELGGETFQKYCDGLEFNKILLPHFEVKVKFNERGYLELLERPMPVPTPVTQEEIEEARKKKAQKDIEREEFRKNFGNIFKKVDDGAKV